MHMCPAPGDAWTPRKSRLASLAEDFAQFLFYLFSSVAVAEDLGGHQCAKGREVLLGISEVSLEGLLEPGWRGGKQGGNFTARLDVAEHAEQPSTRIFGGPIPLTYAVFAARRLTEHWPSARRDLLLCLASARRLLGRMPSAIMPISIEFFALIRDPARLLGALGRF
jgi:hypothetical protein